MNDFVCPARRFAARGFRTACVALALLTSRALLASPQLLPNVYGYGLDRAINVAGFGSTSQVIHVSNLNDSGTGSLRAAIQTSGPRVIVFDTSGIINLASDLTIASGNGNVTIAGQTAPSPGIAVHGGMFTVAASNVLIQHLRFRPGDSWKDPYSDSPTGSRDGGHISNSSNPPINVVFDHCTFQWSLDEAASAWYSWDNVTFNRCIFAEPLHVSVHLDEGTFSSNAPLQAETLTFTKSGSWPDPTTITSGVGIGGFYQLVNTNADAQWIEYTVNVISSTSARPDTHVVVVGITGSNRAKFKVQVRDATHSDNLLLDGTEIFDQYAAAGGQQTWITQQGLTGGLTIPAGTDTLKVRLIVSGQNASSTGWKLCVDQLSLSEGHGFGPLFSAGRWSGTSNEGKLTMTGSIFAHCYERGPWSSAQQFYFANNVNYDRGRNALHLGHQTSNFDFPYHVAALGNTFIEGSSLTGSTFPSPIAQTNATSGSQVFVGLTSDNVYNYGDVSPAPAMVDPAFTTSGMIVATDPTVKTAGLSGVVALNPAAAYLAALDYAGARPGDRDPLEKRITDEIKAGAVKSAHASRDGRIRFSVTDAGGWPTYTVNSSTWTVPANPFVDSGNGYTNIEVWLQGLAQQVETLPLDPANAKVDDFEDGVADGWLVDGGTWAVTGTSPHVYQQTAASQPAVRSVLSGTSWTDQVIEADAKANGFDTTSGFFGVVTRYVDSLNYYYLVLRTSATPPTGTLELKKLVNGTSTLLATWSVNVDTTTTNTLALEVIGTTLKGYLNGTLRVQSTAADFASGRCGLLTFQTRAQFDNVVADPNPATVDTPGVLTATVDGTNTISQINLAWTNVPNETGYKIERKRGSGGTYAEIGTTSTDAVTYSDTTCGAGTQYYYRVRATNANGDSAYSPEANATTVEVTSGRQGHWKFDENSGTTTADASTNNYTGTLATFGSGLPAWTAGKIGSALSFDGSDDYVSTASHANLDNLSAITVTAWIKPNTAGEGGNPGRIVHKATGTTPVNGWQFVTTNANSLGFSVDYNTTDLNRVSGANTITMGAWQHVAVTWTGSATATNVKIYVNGVEVSSYTTTINGASTRVSDTTAGFYIGNDNTGVRTFDGAIDDVRVYNRVISTTELGAIYRAGL